MNDEPNRGFAFGEKVALYALPVGSIVLTPSQKVVRVYGRAADGYIRTEQLEERFAMLVLPETVMITVIRDARIL